MKVLLADDHTLIRDGIKLVLKNYTKAVEFIEVDNYIDTLDAVKNNPNFDLIVMDLFMPGSSGTDGIAMIRQSTPCTPIIVLSSSEDVEHVKTALKLGANGYIPKSSSNDIFLSAINLVMAGGIYIPAQMLNETIDTMVDEKALTSLLTDRQTEVLKLMAQGKTNKTIAKIMSITDHTVKSHISVIFSHLNAANRTQAVINAQQRGLVPIENN